MKLCNLYNLFDCRGNFQVMETLHRRLIPLAAGAEHMYLYADRGHGHVHGIPVLKNHGTSCCPHASS